ncbi:MAG: addiction module protein [Myxococcota bacterium]
MSRPAEELLADVLKLPAEVRAGLAAQLIDSLDSAVDEDAEAAWSAVIARRIAELESGAVRGIPWAEARRRILGLPIDPGS